jgi:hypothetical protein
LTGVLQVVALAGVVDPGEVLATVVPVVPIADAPEPTDDDDPTAVVVVVPAVDPPLPCVCEVSAAEPPDLSAVKSRGVTLVQADRRTATRVVPKIAFGRLMRDLGPELSIIVSPTSPSVVEWPLRAPPARRHMLSVGSD